MGTQTDTTHTHTHTTPHIPHTCSISVCVVMSTACLCVRVRLCVRLCVPECARTGCPGPSEDTVVVPQHCFVSTICCKLRRAMSEPSGLGEGVSAAVTTVDQAIAVEASSSSSESSDVTMEVMRWPTTKDRSASNDEWLLEVFSPPRIVPLFKGKFGGNGVSVDLRTGWDAESWEDRASLMHWVDVRCPRVLVASPPCTMFSCLQITNRGRMDPHVWDARMNLARVHLNFAMQLCRVQLEGGRGFVFEHPRTARSWLEPSVQALWRCHAVGVVGFDQCRYGLTSPCGHLLKKPTRLMTNMAAVLEEFSEKLCTCPSTHVHIQGTEMGRRVSSHAQVYPPLMAQALADCCGAYLGLVQGSPALHVEAAVPGAAA